MKKVLSALLAVLLLGAGEYIAMTYISGGEVAVPDASSDVQVRQPAGEAVEADRGKPAFSWSYRAFEEQEIPRSAITLTARYADGSTRAQEIESIEGGCNEYGELDADTYASSTMIICYYAGLGRYYKVVESDGAYEVRRKVFEEASPDYDPLQQEFETVARF